MDKYLLLRDDDVAEFIEMPNGSGWLDAAYAAIGCDFIDIVDTHVNHLVLVIDDCGKCHDGWVDHINVAASYLYPGSSYGDVIVGNAIVCLRVGSSLIPMDEPHYFDILSILPGPLLIK